MINSIGPACVRKFGTAPGKSLGFTVLALRSLVLLLLVLLLLLLVLSLLLLPLLLVLLSLVLVMLSLLWLLCKSVRSSPDMDSPGRLLSPFVCCSRPSAARASWSLVLWSLVLWSLVFWSPPESLVLWSPQESLVLWSPQPSLVLWSPLTASRALPQRPSAPSVHRTAVATSATLTAPYVTPPSSWIPSLPVATFLRANPWLRRPLSRFFRAPADWRTEGERAGDQHSLPEQHRFQWDPGDRSAESEESSWHRSP